MLQLPILKPELSNLILIPGGTFTVNDGWITSANTEYIFEVKRRSKTSADATYINAWKYRALMNLSMAEGKDVLFIDECRKSGDVNVWLLSEVVVDRIEPFKFFHKASGKYDTKVVAYFQANTGLVDHFVFPSYL